MNKILKRLHTVWTMGRSKIYRSLAVLMLCNLFIGFSLQSVAAGTLYITNRDSGNLAILDEATLRIRKVIPVGEIARGMAVARDEKTACVAYEEGLAIIDLVAGRVGKRLELDGAGRGVAMTKDGGLCYVTVHWDDGDQLVAINKVRGMILGDVSIGERASAVYLAPGGRTAYVPEHDGFSISVIDLPSLTKRRTITMSPLGLGDYDKPHYLAMSPAGTTLYLPFQGRILVSIDTSTLKVTTHPLKINAHQHGIAVSPDGTRIYVANNVFDGEGSLSEIDAKTFKELRRISLGDHHEQIAISASGRRVYLTGGFSLGDRGHDRLTVVNLESGAVSRVGTGGISPYAILRLP